MAMLIATIYTKAHIFDVFVQENELKTTKPKTLDDKNVRACKTVPGSADTAQVSTIKILKITTPKIKPFHGIFLKLAITSGANENPVYNPENKNISQKFFLKKIWKLSAL